MFVYEQGVLPCGGASTAVVKITLWGAGAPVAGRNAINGTLVTGECTILPDASGFWQADLVPNGYIAPENTTYKVERKLGCQNIVSYISVPSEGGPYEVFTIQGDPMNAIAPSALAGHASDTALHGGGIEVDYSELTSNVLVTGNAFNTRYVNGLHVVIPDIARPVYVTARVYMILPDAGPRTGAAILSDQWDGLPNSLIGDFFIIDNSATPNSLTSTTSGVVNLFYRVPPNTPTTIAVGARSQSSPYSATIMGSIFAKSLIRAVTA